MSEELYLNSARTKEVWAAIKQRSIPLKSLTLTEYDSLSDEKKQADILYIITDPGGSDDIFKYKGQTIKGPPGEKGESGVYVGKETPIDPDTNVWINTNEIAGNFSYAGNPIGTIISFMGYTAPKDYLVCDGKTYNVTDYQQLANFFKEQFGSENYFGGDGVTTFAVPDMQNLFLRGYHGTSDQSLSGDVGKTQNATVFPTYEIHRTNTSGNLHIYPSPTKNVTNRVTNYDSVVQTPNIGYGFVSTNSMTLGEGVGNGTSLFTSRPVNMSVLYCIKAVATVEETDDVLKVKDENGNWISIPAIRGKDGLDSSLYLTYGPSSVVVLDMAVSNTLMRPISEIKSLENGSTPTGWNSVTLSVSKLGKNLMNPSLFFDYSKWVEQIYGVVGSAAPTNAHRGYLLTLKPDIPYTISLDLKDKNDRPLYFYLCGKKLGEDAVKILAFTYGTEDGKVVYEHTFTPKYDEIWYLRGYNIDTNDKFDTYISKLKWIQLEESETATEFEPYNANVVKSYTRNFPETIYGGVYNWTAGELTVTHDILNGSVVPLSDPRIIQLTPSDILVPEVGNILSCDTGDTTVTFQADVKKYVDETIKVKGYRIMLSASGWVNGEQTVTGVGVSDNESSQLIQPVPTISSQKAYYEAGIICTGQSSGSLTFTADAIPNKDLIVYVVVQEVSA